MDQPVIITKEYTNYIFSPDLLPVAEVHSGDTVTFQCMDCYGEQIDTDHKDPALIDMDRTNPATGPLFIREAMPGDVLKIEILDITMADSGVMCVEKGYGAYEVTQSLCRRFSIGDGQIHFSNGLSIPIKPMIGVIGTAPFKGQIPTHIPGEHGGNMDINELGAGSTLYLPVAVEGALLSVGDLHALQGDGETAICAMEVSGRVTLRVTVEKDCIYPVPFLITPKAYYTIASDASLDVCSQAAARAMHRYLVSSFSISPEEAAMLLSLLGNLRLSQIVNPKKGCIMELPKAVVDKLEADMER